MKLNLVPFFPLLLLLGLAPLHAQQAQPSAAEQKLRETLRSTMLQLRAVENDKLILQATQTENEAKLKELTAKVDALVKQLGSEKDAADKLQAELQAKLAERDQTIAALNESLGKWKADHQRISDIAAKTEAQRTKLAEQAIVLQRRVDDQQAKNAAMYKIGTEVLNRYQKFVLGDALAAREPFTGIARVKFETLAQDFRDQLDDSRVTPQGRVRNGAPEGAARKGTDGRPASQGKPDGAPVVTKKKQS